jgi:hypothetical protein
MSLPLPSKLRSEVEAREARKIKNFEKILESCYNKILLTNKQCDACCCIFTCPSVVFGLPLFNMYDCINYIITKLVEKGFEVHLAVPNNIYISWKDGSNANYSKKLYQLDSSTFPSSSNKPQYQSIEYQPLTSDIFKKNTTSKDNQLQPRKLFSSKQTQQKEKNYRPIDDYSQSNGLDTSMASRNSYSSNDLDIFRSKIDELIL